MKTRLAFAFGLSLLAAACGDNLGAGDDLGGDNPGGDNPGGDNPGGDNPGGGDETPTSGPCSMSTGIHGIDVVLHDANGAVLDLGVSDGTGLVQFSDCPQNAMISIAAYDAAIGWKGTTVAGVQPFSDLTVVLPDVGWKGTLMAAVPEDGADITNEYVSMATQCGASSNEGENEEIPIKAGCLGYDAEVLTVLETGRIGDVWVYSHSGDIDINMNGVTNVLEEDMSNWTTGGSMPMSASNITTSGAAFLMSWMRNGQPYFTSTWGASLANGSIERTLPLPPSSFSTQRLVGVRAHDGVAWSGYLHLTTDGTADFDLSNAPSLMTAVAIDNADAERPSFSATGIPADSDLGVFRANWEIEGEDVDWRIIFPASEMSTVQFPQLPGQISKATPTPGSAVTSVNVIDITGQSYLDILTTGYTIDKYHQYCAELSGSAQCRFSSLQSP